MTMTKRMISGLALTTLILGLTATQPAMATDSLRLLASVSHAQAESAGEDAPAPTPPKKKTPRPSQSPQ
jgi:hypothetical protein